MAQFTHHKGTTIQLYLIHAKGVTTYMMGF